MPWIGLETNSSLSAEAESQLLEQLTERVARALGKPEPIVMARCLQGVRMRVRSTEEPCAYFDVRGIGEPSASQLEALCASLCDLAKQSLGVQGDRCFVVHTSVPRTHWGLDSKMLG